MWAGKLPPSSSLPWYQRPSYTGELAGAGSIGGLPLGSSSGQLSSHLPETKEPEKEIFFCDSCDKEFKILSQYQAHVATHVTCSHPGCGFQGSQRVVKEHYSETHDGDAGTRRLIESLDTPEEIEKWREARRKNWPSNSNVARKQQEKTSREQRGDELLSNGSQGRKRQKGQDWQIVTQAVPLPAPGPKSGSAQPSSTKEPEPQGNQAAEAQPAADEEYRAPGLDCLLGYESSDSEDDSDVPPEEIKGVSSKAGVEFTVEFEALVSALYACVASELLHPHAAERGKTGDNGS
mmetsp:Transcript_33791/g.52646  ORF Transcript_33791/g.52646 Transcript_33791/m.52646 type:complete len:292 (+) Transcript_33791:124-999(+)